MAGWLLWLRPAMKWAGRRSFGFWNVPFPLIFYVFSLPSLWVVCVFVPVSIKILCNPSSSKTFPLQNKTSGILWHFEDSPKSFYVDLFTKIKRCDQYRKLTKYQFIHFFWAKTPFLQCRCLVALMQTALTALTLLVSPVFAFGVSLESSVRDRRYRSANFRQHQSWESGQWWQWFSQFNAFSVPCFLAGLTVPRHRKLYFVEPLPFQCFWIFLTPQHLPPREVGVLLTVAAFGFLTDRLSFPLGVAWIGFSL